MSVRYLEKRVRPNGVTWYYYCPPKDARAASVLTTAALGTDYEAACSKAEEYNKILDAWRAEKAGQVPATIINGGVSMLFADYLSTRQFTSKAKSTQTIYRQCLNLCERTKVRDKWFGTYNPKDVDAKIADELYVILRREVDGVPTRLAYANHCMRVLRRVWNVQKRFNNVKENPFEVMGLEGTRPRSRVWDISQVRTFVETAEEEDQAHVGLAILLMYETAQRKSDILNLRWDRIKDGWLTNVEQGKTGHIINVPLPPYLIKRLNEHASTQVANKFVISRYGDCPISAGNFSKQFRHIRKLANLPNDLWAMDLRRTAATEMSDAQVSDTDGIAVTGHTDTKIYNRVYSRRTMQQAERALRARWLARKADMESTDDRN